MKSKDGDVSMGQARVTGATDKGLFVHVDDLGAEVFVPFSQISQDSEVYKKDSPPGELVVTEWLAKERGWV